MSNGPLNKFLKDPDLDGLQILLEGERERRASMIHKLYEIDPQTTPPIQFVSHLPTDDHFFMPQIVRDHLFPFGIEKEVTVNPTEPIISFIGKSRAGKSTIFELLRTQYPHGHYYDEFPTAIIDSLTDELIAETEDLPLEIRNIVLTAINLINFQRITRNLLQRNEEYWKHQIHSEDFNPSFIMRGPNDVFALGMWLYILKLPRHPNIQQFFEKAVVEALDFVEEIDAVILFDLSLQTAQKRRVKQRKNPIGRMVNDEYWPIVENGYRWWFHHLYPFLRKEFGIGVLTVNGGNSINSNKRKVLKYINDVREQKMRLRRVAISGPYWPDAH